MGPPETNRIDPTRFAIGFDHRDRARLHELWDEVLDSRAVVGGPDARGASRRRWAPWNGLPAVALSSWAGAALAALEFAGVRGETVLCPSNTFMATPLAAICRRAPRSVRRLQPRRPLHVVRGLRGARPSGTSRTPRSSSTSAATSPSTPSGSPPTAARRASSCSRTAPTPTAPTGTAARPGHLRRRGRLLVLRDQDDLDRRGRRARLGERELIEFAARFRNYGKPAHEVDGPQLPDERVHRGARPRPDRAPGGDRRLEERLRARASRPAASRPSGAARRHDLGPLQVHRLRPDRAARRAGSTTEPCHRIMGHSVDLPNTDWVAEHHWCVPLYYRPDSPGGRSSQ